MNTKYYENMKSVPFDEWVSGLRREKQLYDWCAALPSLPDENFQRRFVGRAYGDAMQQAIDAVELFKVLINRVGNKFGDNDRVVDFGCGWGRISQTLYRYFKPCNIISADIQHDAIDFCRKSGLATKLYHVINQNLDMIEDGSIHHIFAFSVFSHLNEELANKWIMEFYRILKPGGSVAITTRHISFLRHVEYLKTLPKEKIPPHAIGLIEAFSNSEKAVADFNDGCFVYRDYPRLSKVGVGYGEAIIPEYYVEKYWQPIFGGKTAYASPNGNIDQKTILLTKHI